MRPVLLVVLLLICAQAPAADAQSAPGSQPKAEMTPPPGIVLASPLHLQADVLTYYAGGNRVVARGNVELHFKNSILTASEVIYDRGDNTLIARGDAQLKDPDGRVTKADPMQLPDEFREAFAAALAKTAESGPPRKSP